MHGKVLLSLSDNLSAVLAFSKGRAGCQRLRLLCETATSLQICCGIKWHVRHVRSHRNATDGDSRAADRGEIAAGAREVFAPVQVRAILGDTPPGEAPAARGPPGLRPPLRCLGLGLGAQRVAAAVTLVTDFSGIEAPCMALRCLGRACRLLSASECRPAARDFVRINLEPDQTSGSSTTSMANRRPTRHRVRSLGDIALRGRRTLGRSFVKTQSSFRTRSAKLMPSPALCRLGSRRSFDAAELRQRHDYGYGLRVWCFGAVGIRWRRDAYVHSE